MQQRYFTFTFVNAKSIMIFTIISVLLLGTNADSYSISSTNPPQTIGISKSSPRVVLGLDYPNAFEMTLSSLDGKGYTFCQTYPSEVMSKLKWEGPITDPNLYSYDNIIAHKGFYFLVDTFRFTVLAIGDFQDQSKHYVISSPMNNTLEKDQYNEVFATIDEDNSVLYILTNEILVSYELNNFFQAIKSKNPIIPPLSNFANNYEKYSSVENIRFHNNILYIVADNVVHTYFTAANGDIAPLKQKLDEKFFKVEAISAVDIAFYGKKAYVLDSLDGIYVVNVANAGQGNFANEGIKHKLEKGQFIEIVKNSLNVVTSTKKATKLYEYVIQSSGGTESLVLNRVLDIFQAVSDIQQDGNFLYLITGFFNMVIRPLVPSNYDSEFVEGYIMNYWSLFNIKAISTVKDGDKSKVVAVSPQTISWYSFEPETPAIQCNIEDVPEGEYMFQLRVYQSQCDEKDSEDINVICQTKQNIRFVIAEGDAIGDVSRNNMVSFGLGIGLGFMTLLIIVFCVLVRKYKNQYQTLESQFKFSKLKEEQEQNEGAGKHSAMSLEI